MNDTFTMLDTVKTALTITGDYLDDTIQFYIEETQNYLLSAGVSEKMIHTKKCVGVIARGVSDLWNYGNGSTGLSPYFKERVIQLSLEEEEDGIQTQTTEL
ncbi:MAG: hypothetical protein ACLRVU_09730 [Beduini sp.]|uniref:hypothetical protein n=1 Tax=Beduini sp. TaxID=1922300 RepID=UPI0039A0E3E9